MENKSLFTFIGIFAVLFLSLSLVSADVENFDLYISGDGSSATTPISGANGTTHSLNVILNHTNSTFGDVNISWSGGAGYLSLSNNSIVSEGTTSFPVSITLPSTTTIGFRILTATIYNTSDGAFLGTESVNVHYNSTTSSPTPSTNNFCDAEVGNLTIYDFNVDNLGEGTDSKWNPLDEINIDVEVKNKGSNSISDITVEIKITDDTGKNDLTGDFDLEDDKIDLGKIKAGDRETVTFTIKELPADIETGTYRIYVKAYKDGNEGEQCASESSDFSDDNYHEFEVETQYDDPAVVPRGGAINTKITANAGEIVTISFDVYNLGDQEEDDVLVTIENSELKLNERQTFRNMDIGEKKTVSFDFQVPSSVISGKVYRLGVYTYFDYDKGDIYDETSYDSNSYDDLDETYMIQLEIQKAAVAPLPPTITATLLSDATVGNELSVQVSVKNNLDSQQNFVVSVANFESWANLVDVQPQILTLNAGETGQSIIKLTPTKEGTYTFNIKTNYNGEEKSQPVSVNIAGKSGFLTGAFAGVGNTTVYLIAGIVILLIIIIVVLIVKLAAGTKTASEF